MPLKLIIIIIMYLLSVACVDEHTWRPAVAERSLVMSRLQRRWTIRYHCRRVTKLYIFNELPLTSARQASRPRHRSMKP